MCKKKNLTEREKRYQEAKTRRSCLIAGLILLGIGILGIVIASIVLVQIRKNINLSAKGMIVDVVNGGC